MTDENPAAINPALVARVKGIVLQPGLEWPIIAAEQTSVKALFMRYVMILALIPVVSKLVHSVLFGGVGPFTALLTAVVGYGLSLVCVYILGLVIDGLAQNFGSERNSLQSMKVAAYAMTPGWLAGVFNLVGLDGLCLLAGLYGIYLIYLGLPVLMKTPPSKTIGYTAVTVLVAVLLNAVVVGLGFALLMSFAIIGSGAAVFATM